MSAEAKNEGPDDIPGGEEPGNDDRAPFAAGGLPLWVRWVAQDKSGQWWGYEVEPNEGHEVWYENEVGRYVRLHLGEPNPAWRSALLRVQP